jgi:hypothetical protein
MGLDVTAYSHLEPVGRHTDEWCGADDHVQAFAYATFPQSFRGVPVVGIKEINGERFFEGGCYALTVDSDVFDFRAGSYSGYGLWREEVQRQFNPDRDPDLPFYELIWFADNEGTIGPEAARDLLADFQANLETFWSGLDALGPLYERWVQAYTNWTRACQLAADDGLIQFQ